MLPRVQAELQVRFETFEDLAVAYTEDISDGGLFMATTDFLPVGHVVRVQITLPDGDHVDVLARVTFVLDEHRARALGRRPGMGMEFVDAEETKLAQRVREFLTDRLGSAEPSVVPEPAPARVLVVDDARAYRDLLVAVLYEQGHEVATAANGLEALSQALRDPPDLILSDVEMPSMNGWQLLRMVRSRPSLAHVPVIFLTNLRSDEDRLKGYQLGVDDYIGKPFEEEEVAARVARLLSRTQSRVANARNALRGDLSHVSLASLLSFLEVDRRTGLLMVVSEGQLATLHLYEGMIRRVDLAPDKPLEGIQRVHYVLDWDEGHFELTPAQVPADGPIEIPTQFILLEHARKRDETS